MHDMVKGTALGVLATLILGIAIWLIVVYTGVYDVAASDAHTDAIRWTLDTTMRRSVARRADELDLPDTFSAEQIAEGARHYADTCVHCHGAPGREPAGWSRGMRPEPPHLTEVASEWSAEEIHWITDNGIKMTGMPAFGADHGSEELVAITAFVTQLPGLSPEEYAAMTRGAEGHHHGEGGGSH